MHVNTEAWLGRDGIALADSAWGGGSSLVMCPYTVFDGETAGSARLRLARSQRAGGGTHGAAERRFPPRAEAGEGAVRSESDTQRVRLSLSQRAVGITHMVLPSGAALSPPGRGQGADHPDLLRGCTPAGAAGPRAASEQLGRGGSATYIHLFRLRAVRENTSVGAGEARADPRGEWVLHDLLDFVASLVLA